MEWTEHERFQLLFPCKRLLRDSRTSYCGLRPTVHHPSWIDGMKESVMHNGLQRVVMRVRTLLMERESHVTSPAVIITQ